MLIENQKTYYVLMLDGKEISNKHESMALAEMAKVNLAEDIRDRAEITQIVGNGQQVLCG